MSEFQQVVLFAFLLGALASLGIFAVFKLLSNFDWYIDRKINSELHKALRDCKDSTDKLLGRIVELDMRYEDLKKRMANEDVDE